MIKWVISGEKAAKNVRNCFYFPNQREKGLITCENLDRHNQDNPMKRNMPIENKGQKLEVYYMALGKD